MLSSSAARLRDLEDAVYDVSFAFAFRAFHPQAPIRARLAEKARAGFAFHDHPEGRPGSILSTGASAPGRSAHCIASGDPHARE